ncbi:MAG: hypothetical protein ABS81_05970 [Pseudonocardia sp. SCN 72-86]|nr:MAG: hypothetical protein ABS81_05970 [Pseudonocardia sp. SCN 72-86]
MRTIVLDDDPTGTQSATGVAVLLDASPHALLAALRTSERVYVQTNSRALPEREAVRLVTTIRDAGRRVGESLGEPVRFVMRGDSTLRGHVFAETDVFSTVSSVMLFVPAFPAGGRTTRDGVHLVRTSGVDVPAGLTEYASDPVFGYTSSKLADYVAEKGERAAVHVGLESLRDTDGAALTDALTEAPPGAVIVPDAVTDDDIAYIGRGLEKAWADRDVVVRCAAPLAATCAGVLSTALLTQPIRRRPGPILLVCGSHVSGSTEQLGRLAHDLGARVHTVPTEEALADPDGAGRRLASLAAATLAADGLAVIASERERKQEHRTLEHGERVMRALSSAARELAGGVSAVVTKGGITSAEVIRTGIGAGSAWVRGQVLPGISVWDLDGPAGPTPCVVVPGNVGDAGTLVSIAQGALAHGAGHPPW